MKPQFKDKVRLLVISHVLPFPGVSGQQQRVRHTLYALRKLFHITFLTIAPARQVGAVAHELHAYCDEPLVLPSRYHAGVAVKTGYKVAAMVYTAVTGLKISNYLIGQVEFTARHLAAALADRPFDAVLYEYWHAMDSTDWFKVRQIPTVLDMHNILWQSYQRQLDARPYLPVLWRQWAVGQYRRREEAAWSRFDALIAISAAERDYVCDLLPDKPLFYAPMGIDLAQWPYSWQPTDPPRVAYYGGLGSPHNQQDALTCYRDIMPHIWRERPQTELWLVGSNPPDFLRQLAVTDERVKVTGFVPEVQPLLCTMSLVLCPWSGTYGFRSRLVEVMALGVPIVATPDAVHGMDMEAGKGIFLSEVAGMAQHALDLLQSSDGAYHSQLARQQIEQKYDFEQSYGQLAYDLYAWLPGQ